MIFINEFQSVLKTKRLELHLTQQELADQLHVTRQTLSRWENGQSYPNLDTLVTLSQMLHISLDSLLKGEHNSMVEEISSEVRNKRKYKRLLIVVSIVISIIIIWLGILGYGRANQNAFIDYTNPFLKTNYGYAILPTQGQAKRVTIDKDKWIDPHGEVDTQVFDSPLSTGDWLKFTTGQYTRQNRYAIVKHKGSYVESIRLISKADVPKLMQVNDYYPRVKYEPRVAKKIPWLPFS